jgi:hypothetical protein
MRFIKWNKPVDPQTPFVSMSMAIAQWAQSGIYSLITMIVNPVSVLLDNSVSLGGLQV